MATVSENEVVESRIESSPGKQLAAVRTAKGYSIEYVAAKLHLRQHLIENLETDNYANMPEPVFIKGYLRAYAKLMEINPEPFIQIYNQNHLVERQSDRTLWQSRRDTNHAERSIRWVTTVFGFAVLISVAIWWYKSQDNQEMFAKELSKNQTESKLDHNETDIRLTDLSKMRSLLSSEVQYNQLGD